MVEKIFRVLIKYDFMKGKSPQDIREMLNDKDRVESSPSVKTICKKFKNFRSDHPRTNNAERSRRSLAEATTLEIINKMHDLVGED